MSIDSEKYLDSKQNLLKKTQKTLIMRNILFIVIFFIYNTLFSQISMKVSVFSKKEDDYMLKIEVINDSDYDYIIPIDTANYRYYFPEETCTNFYRLENYPDLGIIFKIKNKKNEYMDSLLSGFIHLTEEELLAISKKRKEKERIHREKIKNWKRKYHIKGDYKNIDINWYLYNQLKVLKSKKSITYLKNFNINNINIGLDINSSSYYYYHLDKNVDYPMFLEICIDEKIYDHLTQKQKEEFKGYMFFNGKIQSNEIMIRK